MPFTESKFKRIYTPGDVFYGLNRLFEDGNAVKGGSPRGELILQLTKKASNPVDLIMINNYPITNFEKESYGRRLAKLDSPDAILHKEDTERFENYVKSTKYYNAVNWGHPSNTPIKWAKEQQPAWGLSKKNSDFVNEQIKDGKLVKDIYFSQENAAWCRKSKAGISYIVFSTPYHVHFSLDGINFDNVINKVGDKCDNNFPGTNVKKQRVVTHSELRWIYRNREHCAVQNKVQFWRRDKNDGKFIPCTPPWEWLVLGGDWKKYVPTKNFYGSCYRK